ncbi:hypothetical protein EVA_11743 [gut metagenome]|uniref:Uncharacterized protein n=1 Tax=gut metagenome TaxID=749906 RepID=J9CJC1_9ZZZZ
MLSNRFITAASSIFLSISCPVSIKREVALSCTSWGISSWATLMPTPTITYWMPSAPTFISVRIPQIFFLETTTSLGHLIETSTPVCLTAWATESPITKVSIGANLGANLGRRIKLIIMELPSFAVQRLSNRPLPAV